MTFNLSDFCAAVLSGQHDGDLQAIAATVSTRQRLIKDTKSLVAFATMQIGDRVKFTNAVRPKYLAGRVATVVEKKQKKVVIDMGGAAGRFSGRIVCPVNLLEKI